MVTAHVQGVDRPHTAERQTATSARTIARQPPVQRGKGNARVVRQVRKVVGRAASRPGGGTLFTESVLVINQKPKVRDKSAEYSVYDRNGHQIGEIREVGFGRLQQKVAWNTSSSRRRTLEVTDHTGGIVYVLERPSKVFKPVVSLTFPDGTPVGTFSQKGLFRTTLDLESHGELIGTISFRDIYEFQAKIRDESGDLLGSITRTWAGRRAEHKTRADNYVLEITRPNLVEPLRGMVITAPVVVDTLFQEETPSKQSAKRERRQRRRRNL